MNNFASSIKIQTVFHDEEEEPSKFEDSNTNNSVALVCEHVIGLDPSLFRLVGVNIDSVQMLLLIGWFLLCWPRVRCLHLVTAESESVIINLFSEK